MGKIIKIVRLAENAEKKEVISYVTAKKVGDFVKCSSCGKYLVLPVGFDMCPICGKKGCLSWADADKQEIEPENIDKNLYNVSNVSVERQNNVYEIAALQSFTEEHPNIRYYLYMTDLFKHKNVIEHLTIDNGNSFAYIENGDITFTKDFKTL
jgi:hypothetical protein